MDIETTIKTIIKQGIVAYEEKGYGDSISKDMKKAKALVLRNWRIGIYQDQTITWSEVSLSEGEVMRMDIKLGENSVRFDDDDDEDESNYRTGDYEIFENGDNRFYILKSKPIYLNLKLSFRNKDHISFNINTSDPDSFFSKKEDRIKAFIDRQKCGRCDEISSKNKVYKPEVGCEKCWKTEIRPIECSICLDSECMKQIGVIKCGHSFHIDCLKNWMSRKDNCPLCRKSSSIHSIDTMPRVINE